jgi:hypothetical protein
LLGPTGGEFLTILLKTYRGVWYSVVCLLLCAAARANAAEVRIDSDRMLVVNGERTFVIGLYERFEDPSMYENVAEAGFNLVMGSDAVERLDAIHEHGLYVWLHTHHWIDLSVDAEARKAGMREMVNRLKDHPALLVWELPDEALWRVWEQPVQWRMYDEPAALRKEIAGLNTKSSTLEFGNAVDAIDRLYVEGEYEEAERAADALWEKLGKEPPHPGLSIGDAPQEEARLREGMIEGYRYLKTLDPDHPVWVNHAPRNPIQSLAAFNEAADIVGCDIYPAPSFGHDHSDVADQTLSAVGAYTSRMQEASPGKPVWMVLQAFGWSDLMDSGGPGELARHRRPTHDELRFMAYDAIVRGARGVLWWGTTLVEKPSRLWRDLQRVAYELSEMHDVLAARDLKLALTVDVGPTWGSADRSVEVLGKDAGEATTLLVVNEWNHRLDYTISGLDTFEGRSFHDPDAGNPVEVKDGALQGRIKGHGVHVLRLLLDGNAMH